MILETFRILFQNDAKQAKDDTDKLNQSLSNTGKISNKLGSSLGKTIGKLAAATAAVLSVGALVSSLKASVAYVDQLDKTSRALNVGVKDLDAWGNAVERLGGNAQAFQQSLYLTNTRLNMMGRGSESATEELLKLSSTFEKLSNSKSYQLGRKLGLDESTILLLQKGRRSVEELINKQKEYNTITEKDTEIVRKFKEQLFDTRRAFAGMYSSINSFVLPALTWIAKKFEDVGLFFRKHGNFIEGSIIAIGTAIAIYLVPPLIRAAIASIALNAPLYALIAIVLAVGAVFALAYDDIKTFLEGGESLYGDLIKKWPFIHELFKQLGESFKQLWEVFKATVSIAGNALKSIWDFFAKDIKIGIDFIKSAIDKIVEVYNKVKSAVGLGKKGDQVKGSVDVNNHLMNGKNTLDSINKYPITSGFSNNFLNSRSSSNRSTNVTTGNITIQTQATDPDDIAKQFGKSMKQEVEQAFGNYTDGVLA